MMDEVTLAAWRAKVRGLQTGTAEPRFMKAVDHILDAISAALLEAKPTMEEWYAVIDFLGTAGVVQMRGIGWVVGLTQVVEEINNPFGADATDQAVEGPFHREHDKIVASGQPLYEVDDDGEDIFFEGRVLDVAGRPLGGAEIDVWGTDGRGMYSYFDPSQPEGNCRGKVISDADGRYSVRTKFPQPYTIGEDKMGQVSALMGHQPWRPAHLHFKLARPGYELLITQICFKGEPYIENDSALGVKPHLAADFAHVTQADAMATRGMTRPFYTAVWDFKLQPVAEQRLAA